MENEILIKGNFMLNRYKTAWINKNNVEEFIIKFNEQQQCYCVQYCMSNKDIIEGPGSTREECIKELQMFLGVSLDDKQFNSCIVI